MSVFVDLKRVWINQPSTIQPDHKFHGTNGFVIVDQNNEIADTTDDIFVKFYFSQGIETSMIVYRSSLSEGWKEFDNF